MGRPSCCGLSRVGLAWPDPEACIDDGADEAKNKQKLGTGLTGFPAAEWGRSNSQASCPSQCATTS